MLTNIQSGCQPKKGGKEFKIKKTTMHLEIDHLSLFCYYYYHYITAYPTIIPSPRKKRTFFLFAEKQEKDLILRVSEKCFELKKEYLQ